MAARKQPETGGRPTADGSWKSEMNSARLRTERLDIGRDVVDLTTVERHVRHVTMRRNCDNAAEPDQGVMGRIRHLSQARHVAAVLLASLVGARFVATSAMLGGNVLASRDIRTLADGRTRKTQKGKREAGDAGKDAKPKRHCDSPWFCCTVAARYSLFWNQHSGY
jgi:hypothetical protein